MYGNFASKFTEVTEELVATFSVNSSYRQFMMDKDYSVTFFTRVTQKDCPIPPVPQLTQSYGSLSDCRIRINFGRLYCS